MENEMVLYRSCPRGQQNHAENEGNLKEFWKNFRQMKLAKAKDKGCVMKSGSLERSATARKTSKRIEKSS